MLQRMNDDRDSTDQKAREMEGTLGLALQAIQRLESRTQGYEKSKKKEEPRKAPIILMEDNLTKAKRILMTPKKMCPTAVVVYAMKRKANPGEEDEREIEKMKETLVKKTREYSITFSKYRIEERTRMVCVDLLSCTKV